MIQSAHALPLARLPRAVRRLFLAVLQVALVLTWAASARAEDEGAGPEPKAAGMCAHSAQSITAPPPIYPGDEAVARPCAPPGEELKRGVPLLPHDAPANLELSAEKSAVLPPATPFPGRVTQPAPRTGALGEPGEEHRARSKRPPRA